MERPLSTLAVLRKVAFLTLLGFAVVMVAPPLFAVLSVFLPFALVGFLVWGAFQMMTHGQQVGWDRTREFGRGVCRMGANVAAAPLGFIGVAAALGRHAGRKVYTAARLAGGLLLPMLGGALVGGALGAVGGSSYHDADFRVPAGLLIGATIGLLAGTLRRRPTSEPLTVLPADGPGGR